MISTKSLASFCGVSMLALAATACSAGAEGQASETQPTAATLDPIRHAFDYAPAAPAPLAAQHLGAGRLRASIGGLVAPVPAAAAPFKRDALSASYIVASENQARAAVRLALGSSPKVSYSAGLSSDVVVTHGGLDGEDSTATDESDGAVAVRSTESPRVVFFVPSEDGVEDFTYLAQQPTDESMDLSIAVPAGAGVRLVDDELSLLDTTGTPRIRLAPPTIYSSDGTSANGTVTLPDCAFDASPAGPWGRPVTAPGATTCTVHITWGAAGVTYPALVDPSWASAGNMATARWSHTATLLSTGKVLVAGGVNATGAVGTAELYDPTSNTWAATGSLHVARAAHTATTLASGASVLVAGGDDNTQALASCEVYSATAGTWTTTGSMSTPRDLHGAWSIDATHVLVAGGANWNASTWQVLATSAIFNSTTGTWSATGSLNQARQYAMTATYVPSLGSSQPAVAGGDNGTSVLNSVELYSSGTSSWASSYTLATARENGVMLMTGSGQVTVFGGTDYAGAALASTESTGFLGIGWWANTSLSTARGLAAVVMYGGAPLVIGGGSASGTSLATTEAYSSGLTTVTAGATLAHARWGHTATTLSNGHVLVTGGLDAAHNTPLASAELL